MKLIGAALAAVARLYEWGGYDRSGKYLFDLKRPGWGKLIQQIMKEKKKLQKIDCAIVRKYKNEEMAEVYAS